MENNSQAIEIKGIVRNQTKIGVQDGQCDDIVNLRFKNGSWRVADDGKAIRCKDGSFFVEKGYSQIYVHTCLNYRHLIGLNSDKKLYWFANILDDNETVETILNDSGLATPVYIGQTTSTNIKVSSVGNILIVLDKGVQASYYVFNKSLGIYKETDFLKADDNMFDSIDVLPYGMIRFKTSGNSSIVESYAPEGIDYNAIWESGYNNRVSESKVKELFPPTTADDLLVTALGKQTKNNKFTQPFMVCAALELYDGSYVLASNPVLMIPNMLSYHPSRDYPEKYTGYAYKGYKIQNTVGSTPWYHLVEDFTGEHITTGWDGVGWQQSGFISSLYPYNNSIFCTIASYKGKETGSTGKTMCKGTPLYAGAKGVDLQMHIEKNIFNDSNKDIIKALCVFVSPQVPLYYFGNKEKLGSYSALVQYADSANHSSMDSGEFLSAVNATYRPQKRKLEDVKEELMRSQFFLLKRYGRETDLSKISIIDLSSNDDIGLLENIVQQDMLPAEAFDRSTIIPNVDYIYNSKYHIANYDVSPFTGYPLRQYFQNVNSLSIKYNVEFTIHDYDDDLQVAIKGDGNNIGIYGSLLSSIKFYIKTDSGDSIVQKNVYIPYMYNKASLEYPYFGILNPLISFPDNRAYKADLYIAIIQDDYKTVKSYRKTIALTPMTYYNIAAYIQDDLRHLLIDDSTLTVGENISINPSQKISLDKTFGIYDVSQNNVLKGDGWFVQYLDYELNKIQTESFPNSIKVSKTNNPMYFPVENNYSVGNNEIIALMSNAVAVGTGQTGAAPLYVFCKDGIYSLMVDSTGEMTYSNARIIARDVCNNAKSVTPIDSGVVFTTDRGIMYIAGSEVVEIGSAAEGDVFDITDTSDKAKKIMFKAFTMPQLAEFPQSLIDNTDFLTYIKGAIVNYNHNERELMVSNPSKDYTYVMDRNGNWSRRAFTAQEYVNNYPTSYRIDKAGNFYKVDADDNDTNKVYLLSNIIKLGTIAFKQAYRLVVRGYFETVAAKLGLYVFGSYDGRQWALLGGNERDDTYLSGKFTDIGCKISHTDIRFLRVCLAGKLSKDTRIDYIEVSADGSALNGKLR